MADANTAPRRISMAYILGFSNKPFKDGGPPAPAQPPPPRHPSNFKQMVSTPGGVIEWAASDGRRGRLTGPGKPRLTPHLTASNLAQVPEAKVEVVANKDASNDDGGMGMMGLFDETAVAPASVKPDPPADSGWTKEQDEKLMELRANNGPWAATAEELGKKEHECRERFKQIKPADWRPKDKGKGGNQKKNKQKEGKNQNQNRQNNQDGAKDKGGDTKNANGAPADNTWGWTTTDNNGDAKDNTNAWTGGDGDNKSNKSNNNAGGGFNTDQNTWGSGGGDSGNNGSWQDTGGNDGGGVGWNIGGEDAGNNDTFGGEVAWDTNNASGNTQQDANNNTGGWSFNDNNNSSTGMDGNNDNKGFDSNTNAGFGTNNSNNNNSIWDTTPTAPANPQPPQQPPQQPPSNTTKPLSQPSSTAHPAEYELTPDTTFSASDLRLIARILQQDCQLVWNRVSWRFKDKTGRTLHPDVFERKVTGGVGKGGRL